MSTVRFNRSELSGLHTLRVERKGDSLTLRRGSRPILLTAMLGFFVALMIFVAWLGESSAGSSKEASDFNDMLKATVIGGAAVLFIVATIAGFENRLFRERPLELVIDTARRVAKVKGMAEEVDVSKVTIRLVDVTWRVPTAEGDGCDTKITLAMIGVREADGHTWTAIGGFGARAAKLARRLSPLAEFVTITVDPNGAYIENEMYDVLV